MRWPRRLGARAPRLSAELRRARSRQAAGAVLRSRVRAGLHPVHGADDRGRVVDRRPPSDGRARGVVVGVDQLCVVDQRRRSGGRLGSVRHVRGDGGVVDRGDLRARGVRRSGRALRRRLRHRARGPYRLVPARQPGRPRAAPRRVLVGDQHRLGDRAAPRRVISRRLGSRQRCGHWRSSSTGVGRTAGHRLVGSAERWRDGSSCRPTSPNATTSSSSSPSASRSSSSVSLSNPN